MCLWKGWVMLPLHHTWACFLRMFFIPFLGHRVKVTSVGGFKEQLDLGISLSLTAIFNHFANSGCVPTSQMGPQGMSRGKITEEPIITICEASVEATTTFISSGL